ncbi:MAG: M1 family metallopeptidase [Acidobacteria bacterium]|nr:M1 family metallopeptidase [Acidobacteriota bacterium]
MTLRLVLAASLVLALASAAFAQSRTGPADTFRQLEEILPTPNEQRTASGAPGRSYWQQRADYDMDVELDDVKQRIVGKETVTYFNQSPDALTYVWLQLDQNLFRKDSDSNLTQTAPSLDKPTFQTLDTLVNRDFDGGYQIAAVKDAAGQPLPHIISKTMMRVDLPVPLAPGKNVVFSVEWSYNINNARRVGGRSGYEFFPKDGNYIYEIAQFFPRLAAYNDVSGWQHKQFLGSGEFTLEFGNYTVRITAPDDHVVGATGVLQNPKDVLSAAQLQRLEQAGASTMPVLIVTPEEAAAAEAGKPAGKKTWVFHADNVRDFGFASSRKFIWDAQGHNVDDNPVLAMSFYPKEGNPLWGQYSTAAIIHTLNTYSRYSFSYPYPVAISVNGPIGGMEYPMICFNGPRPEEDGTYPARTKYGLISVVIHEVGHNFFPMVVNSDERQWTWMDEGINSFLQFLTEQEWEDNYPSRRGEPRNVVEYMLDPNQEPIMTNSESVKQLGNNAYLKPATALNILRETVMGRELFDFAFKEYARRWKFKRPMPADFFRTMEDASAVDLDWFWRGWFYSTDHTDISLDDVRHFTLNTGDPDIEKALQRKEQSETPKTITAERYENTPKVVEGNPALADFYNRYDPLAVTPQDREAYQTFVAGLTEQEKALIGANENFYVMDFSNVGGLVMPLILKLDYADGSTEELRIPAEIWRRNNKRVSKLVVTDKVLAQITLDPKLETADADLSNNFFPRRPVMTRFQMFKQQQQTSPNPMQQLEKKSDTDAPRPQEP